MASGLSIEKDLRAHSRAPLVEELEGVRRGIVATKISEAPVVLNGAEEREVVVLSGVLRASLDHGSNGNRVDLVVGEVVVLVPGDEDEGSGGELGEALGEEIVQELSSIGESRIVTVVVDVGSVVGVLGQGTGREILVQLLGIDNLGATSGVVADVVKADEGVVLAVVVTLASSGVALVGEILLVGLPGDTLGLHQVNQVSLVPVVDSIAENHEMVTGNYVMR